MRISLSSTICTGLLGLSLTAAASPHAVGQDQQADRQDETSLKLMQEYVKDHSVRVAVDVGKIFGIMIEGEIKDGDYDAFVAAVKERKGRAVDVFLYSHGGSAVEAMKIGRLVRKLKMHTIVPQISPAKPFCPHPNPAFSDNCTCESACFLIHVAGIKREGVVLGIHRVYVAHEVLRNLSSAEAVRVSGEIKHTLANYLAEMGVPGSYTERIIAIPSGKIEFLTNEDINKDFSGYIPEYQEWMTAKCGDLMRLYDESNKVWQASQFKDTAKTVGDVIALDKDYKSSEDKISKALDCQYDIDKRLAAEAFAQTFR